MLYRCAFALCFVYAVSSVKTKCKRTDLCLTCDLTEKLKKDKMLQFYCCKTTDYSYMEWRFANDNERLPYCTERGSQGLCWEYASTNAKRVHVNSAYMEAGETWKIACVVNRIGGETIHTVTIQKRKKTPIPTCPIQKNNDLRRYSCVSKSDVELKWTQKGVDFKRNCTNDGNGAFSCIQRHSNNNVTLTLDARQRPYRKYECVQGARTLCSTTKFLQ
ncbi:uncharacterized protein [Oscarella lobularis]|uniref:uncharacterized protein n=1 Tax=Oscarella lobularis TaxID=121494 RepID=UPI003313A2A5